MALTPHQQTLLEKALIKMPNGASGLSQADYAKELQSVWDWARLTGASDERIIREIVYKLSNGVLVPANKKMWTCDNCGRRGEWGDGWCYRGTLEEVEMVACCDHCKEQLIKLEESEGAEDGRV